MFVILLSILSGGLQPAGHGASLQQSPTAPTAEEITEATADDAVGEEEAPLPFTANDVAARDRQLIVCDPNAPPVAGPGVTAIYEADSPPSREIRDLGYLVVAICAGIFLVVQAILVIAIVRGRKKRCHCVGMGIM